MWAGCALVVEIWQPLSLERPRDSSLFRSDLGRGGPACRTLVSSWARGSSSKFIRNPFAGSDESKIVMRKWQCKVIADAELGAL
ncbi:hypothetical protein L2E82_39386 [Cichorium intybus]|uniref:Uncharacterized protein n=1 Tax=Cichorium intybus TaxID=13427 RepID=A0ACB9AJ20_CICIN|nr:hypothetical protein L2E82_39386 [Cichorium intybus]